VGGIVVGQVFVVTSGKGGVGKTTVTANLGAVLANLGKKTCLIDADIGLKNLDVVLGLENRILYTIIDVVSKKIGALEALVRHKTSRNLYLLPASQIATKEMMDTDDMKNVVAQLRPHFDIILIDSPAGIESGFRNAVVAADSAIVVTNPEYTAVSDADRVTGLLEKSEMSEENISLVINRFRTSVAEKRGMLSIGDVTKTLAIPLIGIIPDSEAVVVGSNRGLPIAFEGNNELNKIFTNIARRMLGHKIPLQEDYKLAKPTFWRLLKSLFKR
jgi:septum site-determining protein MinD